MKKKTADTPKRRRLDGLLAIAVTGAISLLIAVAIPLGCALSLSASHHRFIQDLSDSLLYAREHGTLELVVDGEMRPGQLDQAEWLYKLISDTGMGSPLSEVPDGEPDESLTLSFGDGSTLSILPTTVRESDGTQAEGTIVSYVRADGHTFAYDTDQLAYRDIASRIAGAQG